MSLSIEFVFVAKDTKRHKQERHFLSIVFLRAFQAVLNKQEKSPKTKYIKRSNAMNSIQQIGVIVMSMYICLQV